MTDRSDATSAGDANPARAARLDRALRELADRWLRRAREAEAARVEAALDRGSFESFPASDPVAPASGPSERGPASAEVDCRLSADQLVFRLAPREPDAGRPPPTWTVEDDVGDGGRVRLRVWVEDAGAADGVPAPLALEPVHASIRPRQHERRSGAERRAGSPPMPAGFDRRRGERRDAAAAPTTGPG